MEEREQARRSHAADKRVSVPGSTHIDADAKADAGRAIGCPAGRVFSIASDPERRSVHALPSLNSVVFAVVVLERKKEWEYRK